MGNRLVSFAFALGLGTVAASAQGTVGATVRVPVPETPTALDFTTSDGWRASGLVGIPLVNPAGDRVGEVRDVVLDRTGTVRTILVGTGGVLGMGEAEKLIPFANVEWVAEARDAAGSQVPVSAVGQTKPVRGVVNLPKSQIDELPPAR